MDKCLKTMFYYKGFWSIYKRNSVEFLIDFPMLEIFDIHDFHIGLQMFVFQIGHATIAMCSTSELRCDTRLSNKCIKMTNKVGHKYRCPQLWVDRNYSDLALLKHSSIKGKHLIKLFCEAS